MDTNKDGKLTMEELRESAEMTGVKWNEDAWESKLQAAGLNS